MEFTDGWLRFREGTSLLTTNDAQTAIGDICRQSRRGQHVGSEYLGNRQHGDIPSRRSFTGEPPVFDYADRYHRHFFASEIASSRALASTAQTLGVHIPAGFTVERVQELQTKFTAQAHGPRP